MENSDKILTDTSQRKSHTPLLPEVERAEMDQDRFKKFLKEEESEETPALKQRKKKETIFDIAANPYLQTSSSAPSLSEGDTFTTVSATPSISKAELSSEVMELLDKVAFLAQTLYDTHEVITKVVIDTSHPSILLQGAEIIVTEYSTAPKMYNVQINACADAIALIQGGANSLIQMIEEKQLPFRFHRVEASLKSEKETRRRVQSIAEQNEQSSSDGNL